VNAKELIKEKAGYILSNLLSRVGSMGRSSMSDPALVGCT
jgi:hypothetical protein